MGNPRKEYPIDPGLISLYEQIGRANLGHALETVVMLKLERRGCETDYIRTRDGYEVDFFARDPKGNDVQRGAVARTLQTVAGSNCELARNAAVRVTRTAISGSGPYWQ